LQRPCLAHARMKGYMKPRLLPRVWRKLPLTCRAGQGCKSALSCMVAQLQGCQACDEARQRRKIETGNRIFECAESLSSPVTPVILHTALSSAHLTSSHTRLSKNLNGQRQKRGLSRRLVREAQAQEQPQALTLAPQLSSARSAQTPNPNTLVSIPTLNLMTLQQL
jgi:hypothetical protein